MLSAADAADEGVGLVRAVSRNGFGKTTSAMEEPASCLEGLWGGVVKSTTPPSEVKEDRVKEGTA